MDSLEKWLVRFRGSRSRQALLERVQSLLSSRAKNARWINCKLVLSQRSQFFHNRRFFSSHAKLRSTIQRLGITLKVCNSLRFAIWSEPLEDGSLLQQALKKSGWRGPRETGAQRTTDAINRGRAEREEHRHGGLEGL